MRLIVSILWIILLVFIILVFLNTPGIRQSTSQEDHSQNFAVMAF